MNATQEWAEKWAALEQIKILRDSLQEIAAGTLDNETFEQFHGRARTVAKEALGNA